VTGYPFRSGTRQLVALAIGALVTVVVGSFVCALLRPLLPVFLAVAGFVAIMTFLGRWRLFRYRGW
jgi:hypothetical protein